MSFQSQTGIDRGVWDLGLRWMKFSLSPQTGTAFEGEDGNLSKFLDLLNDVDDVFQNIYHNAELPEAA